ncbi:hypothetical protein PLICRDRAFT_377370 [Plicaturopsis crispa FD-325 SS-3]|nr:hypothetical protein PLICRDRAFT_377370 [Plicaturopsis crispa FD-325 SS-3]
MPPLPPLHEIEPKLANLPNAISAYRVCLRVEGDAVKESDRIAARVLGYLILHTLSSPALAQVVKEIHSCHEDQDLYALGEAFTHRFIREFRKYKGRTPWSSDHPSRPSFDVERAALLASIKEAPKDHSTAKKLVMFASASVCDVSF